MTERNPSDRRADWHTPADCHKLLDVEGRLNTGAARMERIENSIADVGKKLDNHIETSRATNEGVTEILGVLSAAKGFFKVVGWVGFVAKWALALCIPILTFLHLIKGGSK